MSKQSALFTIALLLTFMSTQVVYASAAEPSSLPATAHKSKSAKPKSKTAQRHSAKVHKQGASSASKNKKA
jgi:hypothetical protein